MDSHNNEIKVGLFGYGYWGRTYYRALSELVGVKVSYVCDANIQLVKSLPTNITFFNEPEKAIDEGGVDAVFVITPAESHKTIALEALKKGLNCFVEKPALLSSSDLDSVLSHKTLNTAFFPGHIYAYNDMVKSFVKSVAGTCDKINFISSSRMALGPVRKDIGCVWDLLPHDLTIFDLLDIGKPVSVSCIGYYPLKLDHEDVAHCDIQYTSGLVASVELSWVFPFKIRRISAFTEKSIHFFDETNKDLPLGSIIFEDGILEGANHVAYERLATTQYIQKVNYTKSEPLKNMINTFLNVVESNDKRGEKDEILRAKMVISTIEAVLESIHKNGKKINIRIEK